MQVEPKGVSKSPKIYVVIFLQDTTEIPLTPSQTLMFLLKLNS